MILPNSSYFYLFLLLCSFLTNCRDDSQGVDSIMGNAMDLMTQQNIPGLPGSHTHNNLPGTTITVAYTVIMHGFLFIYFCHIFFHFISFLWFYVNL
jgi:hypothetical protein